MEKPRPYSLIIHSLIKVSLQIPLFLAFILIAGLLLPPPAHATSIAYNGTTLGGPTWNRPVENGDDPPTDLSGDGDAVPFDVHEFTVDTAGIYALVSNAIDPFGWDNYTFLYVNTFDPTAPL